MKQMIEDWFLANEEKLIEVSRKIWKHPELSEQEIYAADQLKDILKSEGFTVSSGIAGLPTAFSATWGHGSPRIGFLAEYDALPGLSQGTFPARKPIADQPLGHGCGHNLLGVGAVGAGMALKATMEAAGLSGTVVIYGCPSEEIMMGKIVMAQQHVFDDLDVALSWHPGDLNRASEMSYQAMLSLDYEFTGKASHAAMAPQEGLSALDAVELMNVGSNYYREHMPIGGQIHYIITNGGDKPNIVPEKASVWYFIRANTIADVRKIEDHLDDIAHGAALMTGTSVVKSVRTGCNETRIVPALVQLMDKVMTEEVNVQEWTEQEKLFSRELVQNLGLDADRLAVSYGTDVSERPLHDSVVRTTGEVIDILGSSDLSDVSWIVPTAMLFSACYPKGTPNHTWGVTACSGMGIGQKGMLYAAKVLAITALHLVSSPSLLKSIKESFLSTMGTDTYKPANI